MTWAEVVSLVSWPAAACVLAYTVLTLLRFRQGKERLPHALAAVLGGSLALGILLRPLDDIGLINEPERSVAALILRVVALIVALGLVWNLVDKWRDQR